MSGPMLNVRHGRKWKALYKAAISAGNASVPRIAEAEMAITARSRELSNQTGPEAEVERDSLEDALYMLRALRNTVTFRTAA
jgi:hypothetical protein